MPLFGRKSPTPRFNVPVPGQSASDPVAPDHDNDINLAVHSLADAKRAMSTLKLRKKELALQKRQVMEQERLLRATHTDQVRHQSPMMRGGGGLGRFVRGVQQAGRAGGRAHLAEALRPLEQQRNFIETEINLVDGAILKVEGYIAQSK